MKHNIDDLLDKYWDGETSLEDEKSLRQYFCSNDIDESHLAYRDLLIGPQKVQLLHVLLQMMWM